ncbi:hypothetical protein [Stenotrophomonas sp. MMGLT7]|uniref:hypothetical protein n=1 Tax=Stenotrophomonas sp. MMGLT7 TaxID=2901227 RepID=UPI001E59E261|nr:hypothetical protein [Stenotrophomonas sp. MMGLT7]MCD7097185.1 hypothetical protein [Stenotrophomonas sp. MMGLT7]
MTLSKMEMAALASELTAVIDSMPPQPVELVLATGQIFSVEALNLARIYDNATNGQRDALNQIASAFQVVRNHREGS